MNSIAHKMAAEAIGMFIIVFCGCGAVVSSQLHPLLLPPAAVPFIFGLAVMIMIYATGHISGAHFNPAVTLAFAIVKRFSWKQLAPYWLAQFGGAMLGMFAVTSILPATESIGQTLPSISLQGALMLEALLTFILMFVIISVATDSRAVGVMAGVAIGAAVTLCAFVGGAYTGASMNPARSLAPAVFSGNVESLWIYVASPFAGAVMAALTYEKIRCDHNSTTGQPNDKPHAKGCC